MILTIIEGSDKRWWWATGECPALGRFEGLTCGRGFEYPREALKAARAQCGPFREVHYRDWIITPAQDGPHAFEYAHAAFEGAGDPRHGTADTNAQALACVDEREDQ